jgi:P-type conjugative transfer protein TrbJ
MNRPSARLAALALAVALLLGVAVPTHGQFAVYDVANWVENLRTAIQTYIQIVQQVEEILRLYEQLETMYENLEAIEDPDWRQIHSLLVRLDQLLAQTDGVLYSMSQLEARFRELFPGAEPSLTLRADTLERAWASLETARAALLFTRDLSIDNQESQWTVNTLRAQTLGAEGNLAALHGLGIQLQFIGEEMSKNTHQLFVLTNLAAVEAARKAEDEAAAVATFEELVNAAQRTPPNYDTAPMIPVVPPVFGW